MRARHVFCLVSGVAVLLSACAPSTVLRRTFPPAFPHEEYARSLRQAGLDRTALGRDWLAAAEGALETALSVTLPYRETGYFAPDEAGAAAYRFEARRGQRLRIEVELEASEAGQLFIDLFRPNPGSDPPEHVTSAPAGTGRLEFEVTHDGAYLLRLQPELLRGGRYTLTQHALASLRFPVLGKDSRAVASVFGAERDGGHREHHGIDILAPRGTPVLSAGDGVVSSVAVTDIGGKVVWVWDPARDLSLYYAHLDSQGVSTGTRVRAGDALGTVGNTGNARTTVPHLHFGIYHRREGPIDPMPFVHEPPTAPAPPVADTSPLGTWRRIDGSSVPLLTSPVNRAGVVVELPPHTVVRVQGATASWYRVRLPDDRAGFVPAATTRPVDVPLRSERRAGASPIRDRPTRAAATLGYMEPDRPVPVLGRFNDYLLVRAATGKTGWLASD
jgi:peptidoglycan LD-endopeptidase LytH